MFIDHAIPVRTEPGDMIDTALIHFIIFIQQAVVNMHDDHLAYYKITSTAFLSQRLYFKNLTFKIYLAFHYHRWSYNSCLFFGKACFNEFIRALWEFATGQ